METKETGEGETEEALSAAIWIWGLGGCGYYRCVAAAVKLKNKNKKEAAEIVYSLFFLTVVLTVVLILTAAITESKPTSAISPIGVSAGTGAGGAQSIRIPESAE